jgi:hypothetical protein
VNLDFIAAGIIGVAAGLVWGGRLGDLGRIPWRWPLLLVLALAVRTVAQNPPPHLDAIFPGIFVASSLVFIAWIIWHAGILNGFWLIALGTGLNLTVIVVNGGHMPLEHAIAQTTAPELAHGPLGGYIEAGPATMLAWLDDWLRISWFDNTPLDLAFSPGDVVIAVGLAAVGFEATRYASRSSKAATRT